MVRKDSTVFTSVLQNKMASSEVPTDVAPLHLSLIPNSLSLLCLFIPHNSVYTPLPRWPTEKKSILTDSHPQFFSARHVLMHMIKRRNTSNTYISKLAWPLFLSMCVLTDTISKLMEVTWSHQRSFHRLAM